MAYDSRRDRFANADITACGERAAASYQQRAGASAGSERSTDLKKRCLRRRSVNQSRAAICNHSGCIRIRDSTLPVGRYEPIAERRIYPEISYRISIGAHGAENKNRQNKPEVCREPGPDGSRVCFDGEGNFLLLSLSLHVAPRIREVPPKTPDEFDAWGQPCGKQGPGKDFLTDFTCNRLS